MNNITYAQVETLLKKYTTLKASWKAWYLEYIQEATKLNNNPEDGLFTEEEILLTQFIGNHVLSDMPHGTPNPGDKLLNVILAKDKIMEESLEEKVSLTLKGLKAPILKVGRVITRIDFAMESLSVQERSFVEKFYFDGIPWKAVLESTGYYIEEKRAMEIRQEAVIKIVQQLQDPKALVTLEDYEFCMKELGRNEKE
jgi:hypothetical protein